MDLTGYGLATLALFFFGLYMVPRKLTRLRDVPFVLSMSLGIVITTSVASLILHGTPLRLGWQPGEGLAFLCGPLWYVGVLFYSISVSQMGLTLATPIKNTTAVLGTLVGLLAFAEWRETRPVEALIGSMLVVVSAIIISRTGESGGRRSSVNPVGIAAAIGAAIFFASYTAPFKLAQQAGVDTVTLIGYMGLGIVATAALGFGVMDRDWRGWWGRPRREHLYAALCGGLWVLASVAMGEAIRRIGLAITWPFTNLNTFITVACGIVIFHEINVRKFWKVLVLGLAVGVAGVVLLGLARL